MDKFGGGSGTAYSLTSNGEHLLLVFTNRTFSIWEFPAIREGARHPLPVNKAAAGALANGGRVAAFIGEDGNVVFWHRETQMTNWLALPDTNRSSRPAFSSDGRKLALAGWQHVTVVDVSSGTNLLSISASRPRELSHGAAFSLRFSPDSNKIIVGFGSGDVKLWDLAGGGGRIDLKGHTFQVNGSAFLDAQTVITSGEDVRFWDLSTPTPSAILQPRPAFFMGTALSGDGRRLAVGGSDGVITLWDTASRQEVLTLSGHTRPVQALAFLPDGNSLVSVGMDQIRVWRAFPLAQ